MGVRPSNFRSRVCCANLHHHLMIFFQVFLSLHVFFRFFLVLQVVLAFKTHGVLS